MNTFPSDDDDELVRRIRRGFEAQEIPARPSLGRLSQHQPMMPPPLETVAGSARRQPGAQIMATLSIVFSIAVIALAMLRPLPQPAPNDQTSKVDTGLIETAQQAESPVILQSPNDTPGDPVKASTDSAPKPVSAPAPIQNDAAPTSTAPPAPTTPPVAPTTPPVAPATPPVAPVPPVAHSINERPLAPPAPIDAPSGELQSPRAPPIPSQPPPPPSALLGLLSRANTFLGRGLGADSDFADRLGGYLAVESVPQLSKALMAVGQTKGVVGVKAGASKDLPWIKDDSQLAFTYRVDFSRLTQDVARFVDVSLGDEIFDDILNGIRDDPDGPRIDLRGQVLPRLKDEVILVVNRHPQSTGDSLLAVIPVNSPDFFRETIRQAQQVDPESSLEKHGKIELMVTTEGLTDSAFTVVGNHLIVGKLQAVKDAIIRFTNTRP